MAISKEELLSGRDKTFASEYTDAISNNLDILLQKMNVVRNAYGTPMFISSGWRPASINGSVAGAAPNSNHVIGAAVDVRDTDGALWAWVLQHLDLMQSLGLYMEDKRWTPTWVHFSFLPPGSKKRIFVPQKGLPPAPTLFDGRYDSKWDK